MRNCVLFALLFKLCSSYKLLAVFPVPSASHGILGEGFVRHLINAGHEVTYITPLPIKEKLPNLRQVDVSDNFNVFAPSEMLGIDKLMKKEVDVTDMHFFRLMMSEYANATIWNPNVRKIMDDPKEKFDAVIVEWLYSEVNAGFASLFNCPLIWSSSMDPHAMVLWLVDDWPNPAYTADHASTENPPFTFLQRVKELWTVAKYTRLLWEVNDIEIQIYNNGFGPAADKRGVKLASYNEVKYNGSLMLGNSHVSIGQPMRLPQNYKPILGYHIEEKVKPLPENIQKILDNAPNGVIYFSMGSNLMSASIPDVIKRNLLEMFGSLKQTVLWKFEETLPNLPKNVQIVKWAPQQSILAHPNCILFITHGGLLSITETIHFGVPIIAIPMFGDQFLNANRAVNKGFAQKVDFDWDIAKNLKVAIEEGVGNPSYRKRVKELSFIYHHRPMSPGKELVHWVEHVIQTGGAPHLRSLALSLPFYQKLYLDLAALILVAILITIQMIKIVMSKSKTKKNKEKQR